MLRGFRIVVPDTLRNHVLRLIHEGHPGMQRSPQFAREKVWCPGITADLDAMVSKCIDCKWVTARPRPEPMHRHKLPDQSWVEVSMGLMGPLPNGKQLLVLICNRSRFPVVRMMGRTASADVIAALRDIFSERGSPRIIRMDNGPQFKAEELREFLRREGIEMDYTTLNCPRQNGLVERMYRSIKEAI